LRPVTPSLSSERPRHPLEIHSGRQSVSVDPNGNGPEMNKYDRPNAGDLGTAPDPASGGETTLLTT
jgi:hypothetical protein